MPACDHLLLNTTLLTAQGTEVLDQAVAVSGEHIEWCGSMEKLPSFYKDNAKKIKDCRGKLLTPGLIDCHTHIVYAGDRAREFKLRMEGASYEAIARAGGGILSTVKSTRNCAEDDLVEQSLPRAMALANQGVTTLEIKSGYGLDLENELKILRAARRLGKLTGLRIKTSFLGAHAVPPEYKDNAQAYVDHICYNMLPEIARSGLADAVDVFCEKIAFTREQTEQIFAAAEQYSFPVKCHAEQLSNLGASVLAAKVGALSCDHLEYLDEDGVEAMSQSGTVAVLLPGAYYYLRETRKPPVELLRKKGVGMAVATDSNPGTSPTTSLLLMLNMACQFFSLTVPEALSAVTFQAARALGIEKETGVIAKGMTADLNLWSINDSASLCYHFAVPFPHETMIAGKWVNRFDYPSSGAEQ
ncbi:imidazolonepropionase [Legionella israelensis]|uniref:Imidazolonepropionase n=1 Tax=Legionella israelensis TaxID=454 RepID=A0A0W0W726_9GAMM|nr:imidazolonepropionase [Legionella israelensis]KTD28125.1 imidazolonepropionase [Legionella israelensis]QBS11046.1 imidazolonepropionase [Legionella israelensis]SCY31162.1 imidazolonepropionase [Legionella israelensis DSM 19235]STX58581.1 imidazolonepropionase [Legionella israelensis]